MDNVENISKNKLHTRSSLIKEYSLFALASSILAGLLGYDSNWISFIGIGATVPDKFDGLMVTTVFLVAWFLYGIVNGYSKKKGFIQFLSFYWGIGGGICLIATLMAPIGKFALLVIPLEMLILLPNLGLSPYFPFANHSLSLYIFLSVLFAWLIGVVGYLLGFQLKNSIIKKDIQT